MPETPFDAPGKSDGSGESAESEANTPTQPTQLYAEPHATPTEALPPAHPPTPISQRAIIPTPVDRGRTQPADPITPKLADQAGYGGRFPFPAHGIPGGESRDATTIRTGQAQPFPQSPPAEAARFRQLSPGADAPANATPTTAQVYPSYTPPYADRPAPYHDLAPRHGRPLRGRWVIVGVAALLAVLVASSGYALFSYLPSGPLRAFCADLTSQRYDAAYAQTDQHVQSLYSQQQFIQDMTTLDLAEGTVSGCQSESALAFTAFPLGSSQFSARITRQAHGATRAFNGALTVAYHGGWQIDSIATPLFGVNLGALGAVDAYCAALRSQNYQRAYQLLGADAQADTTTQTFMNTERLHDLISGTITACGVVAIGQGNTDTQATLTLGVTRQLAGALQGAVTLVFAGGAWTLHAIPTQAEGPDVGPYLVGQQFCADMAANRFDDAYNLFTPHYQAANPRAQFVSAFESGQSQGISYGCDTPDFTTYRVTGASASYVVPFIEALAGLAIPANDTLTFALQSNGHWLISNSDVQTPF